MTFTKETPKQNYFLSQPHQPFFILGIANAAIMMLLFALNYKGVITLEISSLIFHVYSLVFLVFTNVFIGFLFTTFPRFCQTTPITKNYYTRIFYANLIGLAIFVIGIFSSMTLVIAAMTILFISQIYVVLKLREIFKRSTAPTKEDPYWIYMASKFGLAGHFLFILATLGFGVEDFAVKLSFYMYLIFLTFSVGQRMIPFFSHSFEEKDKRFTSTVFVLLILKTLLATFDGFTYVKIAEIILDILLGLYLLNEFLRWKLKLFSTPPIVWVLQLGLFWLPTALFVDALALGGELFLDTSFYFLGVHLIAIGFLTTVLIGFGTRVTLGHSGQPPHADKYVTNLFYFIQVVVILRALYSLNIAFGWGANFLFDISFTAWLVLFLLWGGRYAKVLIFGTKL